MFRLMFFATVLVALVSVALAETQQADLNAAKSVTFYAADEKVSSVLDRVCKQTSARVLMEKTADVKVTLSVNKMPLEDALTAICKAGKLEWRKLHVKVDSPLLKKPDSLAATVRLMAGLQFPDVILEAASTPERLTHLANQPAVDSIPEKLRKDMGLVCVYLVTNDKAAKIAEEKENTRLAKYMRLNKELMKLFMEMTPEEREQAMAAGMNLVQNMDPSYMAEMTKSVMKLGPDVMGPIMQNSMNAMMQMSPEDRRAMIRMQMQAMQFITPEMQKMLQEDAMAVLKEMGIQPGQKTGP